MSATTVHVSLEKTISDNNYGHERAEASITYELEPGEDPVAVIAVLQGYCRQRVECDLGTSASPPIRRALVRPDGPMLDVVVEDEEAPF